MVKGFRAALTATLLALLSTLLVAPAGVAEVRAQSDCPKVGQTAIVGSVKYFCIARKSNGTYYRIWNKGSNFPESPSKKLSVRSIAFTALKEMHNQQPVRTDKVDAHIDPALDPKIRDLFLTYADDSMRFWGKDYLPDATMFIGAATSWYVKEQCDYYKSLKDPYLNYEACINRSPNELGAGSGWPFNDPNQLSSNGAVYGPIAAGFAFDYFHQSPLYLYLSTLESRPNLNIGAVLQHELTHIAQWAAYGVGGSGSARAEYYQRKAWTSNLNFKLVQNPTLWVEGSAYYFGNSLGEMRTPGILERDMTAQALGYLSKKSKDIDFLISEPFPYIGPNMTQAQNDEKNDFYSTRYIVGGLMTELMCAKFGMAKCMAFNNVWAAGAYDPSATFQSVFEKHFTMPWATFTKATNAYVTDVMNSKPTPLTKYFA